LFIQNKPKLTNTADKDRTEMYAINVTFFCLFEYMQLKVYIFSCKGVFCRSLEGGTWNGNQILSNALELKKDGVKKDCKKF